MRAYILENKPLKTLFKGRYLSKQNFSMLDYFTIEVHFFFHFLTSITKISTYISK